MKPRPSAALASPAAVRRRLAWVALVAGLNGAVWAAPGSLPGVRVLSIGETGALAPTISGDETAQDCARFRPAEAQLRRYFRQARRVSFKACTHDREGRGLVTLPQRGNLYFHCAGCLGATP